MKDITSELRLMFREGKFKATHLWQSEVKCWVTWPSLSAPGWPEGRPQPGCEGQYHHY